MAKYLLALANLLATSRQPSQLVRCREHESELCDKRADSDCSSATQFEDGMYVATRDARHALSTPQFKCTLQLKTSSAHKAWLLQSNQVDISYLNHTAEGQSKLWNGSGCLTSHSH